MRHNARRILLALCLLAAAQLRAGTVDWGATVDNGLTDALGIPLAPGDLLLVGTFNINDATIQANSGNLSFLAQHFIQFGSSTIGSGVSNIAGYWFQHSVNSIDTLGVGNSRIYIWAFNSSSMNTATEQGIFSQTAASNWLFPPSDASIASSTAIDLTDLTTSDPHVLATGADIVIGGFNSTNNPITTQPMFGTALILVPEPSTYALALVGGAIVFLVRRRRST